MTEQSPEMIPAELPTRTKRYITYAVYIALLVIMAAIGTLLYWSFQSTDVLNIKNAPFPVRTVREHPTADGVVILHIDYCKNIKATGRVRTSFVAQSREIFLPVATDTQPPQCLDTEVPVLIPSDLPPGKYRIKFRTEYRINPIKTAIEDFDSVEFEVVGNEVKPTEE